MHPEREIETEIVLGFESSPRDPLRRRRSETVWFRFQLGTSQQAMVNLSGVEL
jgi:hypothetical protein